MRSSKNQNVFPYFPKPRILLVYDTMGSGKDHQIYEDQRQRHNRPATNRHVLVLDWDNHAGAICPLLRLAAIQPPRSIHRLPAAPCAVSPYLSMTTCVGGVGR
jgi:hypothetical protein